MSILNNNSSIKCIVFTMVILSLCNNVSGTTNPVPEPFRGSDKNSTITIQYDDYSEILKLSVLNMGRSNREKSPKATATIGTRVKSKRNAYTDMEGNRFLFDNFKNNKNKALITKIRKSLETVPDEVPMRLLNPKEQLAYWLNLYNIALIEQLINIYPRRNIDDELYDNGIMQRKFLNVSNVELSLDDIHRNIILSKFSDSPFVIYGLFQGTIGGPNIRKSAYRGETVIAQLRDNAIEFVNSNRGTFKDNKNSLRVSSYYEYNRQLFPDFNRDLKNHLLNYIDEGYLSHLQQATKMRPNIRNMSIADITGGRRKFSSSAATNVAAFIDSMTSNYGFVGNLPEGIHGMSMMNASALSSQLATVFSKEFSRYSDDTVKMLMQMREKANSNSSNIIIKEDSNPSDNN